MFKRKGGGSKAFWTMLKKLHFSLVMASLTGSLPVSLWLSMALCDSHSGSHWLSPPLSGLLWPSLAHYCSLTSLIQSLIIPQGPCSALSAAATLTHFVPVCYYRVSNQIIIKKMMRKTWDNDEAWYRTQHDTGPVPEDPFPFIPNWPIPNLRHTHTTL